MRYTICLLCLLFISCQTEKGEVHTSPDYEFKGKVKTVLNRLSRAPVDDFGEVEVGEHSLTSFEEYTPNGLLTNKTVYYEGESLVDTVTIVFNYENGHLVTKDDFIKGKLDRNLIYENTASGLPKKVSIFRDGALLITKNYRYDALDHLLEEEIIISSGGIAQTKYTYDSLGYKTGKALYENKELKRHWKYFYDEQGQVYKEADLHHVENWADEIFYTYGESKELLESFRNRAYMSGRSSEEKIIYKYGLNDKLIEQETHNQYGIKKETWEYQYDEVGNWTKEVKFEIVDGVKIPLEITTREFEYY